VKAVLSTFPTEYDGEQVGVAINNIFMFDSHYFIYDSGTLGQWLNRAGFVDVAEGTPGHSSHPALNGIDAHGEDFIAFETLVMEARKPT
jgi:hypothetical protein